MVNEKSYEVYNGGSGMDLRDMALAALFASLTAAGAFLKIPLGAAAITLQFLFTAWSGVLLGRRWGAISQGVYVCLGLVGMPVFAGGGGLGYLLSPGMGYVLGLIPAAWVIGWQMQKGGGAWRTGAACVAGLAALYLVALPYLYLLSRFYLGRPLTLGQLLVSGMLVYLPGDLLKVAMVALSAPQLCARLKRV